MTQKIDSQSKDEIFHEIVYFITKNKCTLSQFKEIEDKVHHFYEDNAILEKQNY